MIYRPPEPFRLWDTWLYPREGEFHLFYLRSDPPRVWDHIGHAVSTDLVHWDECDPIPTSGPEGAWDHGPTLTGMVVRHDERFWMFYGAPHEGVQRIGLMVSDDLHAWQKVEHNPVLAPAPPHYQAAPRPPFADADWRDPCAVWREDAQAWEAYICARRDTCDEADTGACIARVRSPDLLNWELLPPAAQVGRRFANAEVPDAFELEGRRYLLFSTITASGRRLDTPSRQRCAGTFYLVAEGGDYRTPPDPLLLGAGWDRFDAYVGRTIAWEDGRLLYHLLAGPRPSWGLPKIVRAGEAGSLWLQFWPGATRLEAGAQWDGFGGPAPGGMDGLGEWQRRDEELRGRSTATASTYLLPHETADFHLCCEIQPAGCERAALVFRLEPESRRGLALILDWKHGRLEIGAARPAGAGGCVLTPVDAVDWPLEGDKAVAVRVLARAEFVEAYLNDRWAFSTVLADQPRRGLLGAAVEGGEATFRHLRCADLEPLD